MKQNESSVFVFIASIIVGILIALNINFSKVSSNIQLTTKEYSDAVEKRNKLRKEVSDLKDDNYKIIQKINEYSSSGKKDDKVVEDLKAQLKLNKMVDGFEEVTGPGLKITLNDGDLSIDENGMYDPILTRLRILHDEDMANVINEIRNAGGEAIAINKQRVLPNSFIICNAAFLNIDDVQLPAPFEVEVIGDAKLMKESLQDENGYLRFLKNRGLRVEIEEETNIVLPAIEKKSIAPNFLAPYIK
ncbi:DUF881 domain-containing protein [Clostridium sp. YIM B02551]|uniref:DUF881 domain-containing protein n=1 Tax=Clostridium sp. YIM B02551 TaxID=2910679 RepID=UPI001EEC44C5|nr:DUF881 domain-containing protein [Clostridium sp. YIM B02551]